MFLLAVLFALTAQQPAPAPPPPPPQFGTVGVRGAIDGAGYSAPAAEKAQSRLTRDLVRLAASLPCPRSAEQNAFTQGVEFYAQGQTDKARQQFATGHSTLFSIGRAALLYNDGYTIEARDTFLQAAKTDPASSEPFVFLARLAVIPGAIDPATLVDYGNKNPQAKFAYAQSLLTAGNDQKAEPLLRQVISADPSIAEAHFQLAALYARHQNPNDAIAEYRTALQLDPTLTEIHYRLAQLYLHAGQKEEGEKELRTPIVSNAPSVITCQ